MRGNEVKLGPRNRLRVVSLLGSATEIVSHLGLESSLVGISHECDYPPTVLNLPRLSRPRFDPTALSSGEVDAAVRRSMEEHGSGYEIDRRALAALKPDLVLTQAVCHVCAVPADSAQAAVDEVGCGSVLSLDAHSLDGIWSTVRQVAEALGQPGRG